MTTVAVLNASYEQLGSTKLGRAIALVMRGEAVIQEADDSRLVRSSDLEYPWPLVIRMLRFIKVPFVVAPQHWSKHGVLKRDNHACGYCGKTANTVDHILPQSRGGRDTWENTVAACSPCNSEKADRTPEEAGMTLWTTPEVPMRVYLRSK